MMFNINKYKDSNANTDVAVIKLSQEYIESFVKESSSNSNVYFMLDVSGSMYSAINNSHSPKIKLVKDSVCSVFDYLSALGDNGHNVNTSLFTFNDSVHDIFSDEKANSSTLNHQKAEIEKIYPHGSTNIRNALNYCNEKLKNLPSDNSTTNIVIFVTDGYHTNQEEIVQMIDEFKTSGFENNYYSIGLGIAGDYDSALMPQLFTKFTGCPTSNDACDNIIGSSFSGTSCTLKNVKIEIIEDENYIVSASLDKHDGKYVLERWNLSTTIPMCIKKKQGTLTNATLKITGTDNSNNSIEFVTNMGDDSIVCTFGNIFVKFFEFEKKYLEIISSSESKMKCKFTLEKMTLELNDIIMKLDESNEIKLFYVNLKTNVDKFISDITGLHVSNLNDTEFKEFLNLGSAIAHRQTSNGVIPTLSRQVSSTVTQQFSQSVDPYIGRSYSEKSGRQHKIPKCTRYTSAPSTVFKLSSSTSCLDEDILCKICLEENSAIQTMYLPCKHACACMDCARKINECPICRTQISGIKEIRAIEKCVKCKTNDSNVLFMPCSHVGMCNDCVSEKKSHICNVCKMYISKAIKIYN